MEYNVNISNQQDIDARHHRYGKPVRFDITLQAGNYLVYNDNGELELISYQDFLLPLTSVCSFRRSKNRSRTMDVTEQYLPNFWVIDIQGLCLNDFDRVSHRLAHEQKELLQRWDDIAQAVPVLGEYFSHLKIDEIEITDISFGQIVGKPDQIPFSIRAESHKAFEIETYRGNGNG